MPTSDANTHDTSSDTAATAGPTSSDVARPEFLTVAEAAQLLRISPRSIQRRCHAGTLSARRVETKFGEQWEVSRAEVEKAAAAQQRHEPRQSADKAVTEPRRVAAPGEAPGAGDATATAAPDSQKPDRSADDLAARYVARLETENDFLRATVEQHQRSEAELRAALREALKAQPRQLTQGNAPEAPPSAPEPLKAPANSRAERTHVKSTKGPEIAPETAKTSDADFEEIQSLIHKVFG